MNVYGFLGTLRERKGKVVSITLSDGEVKEYNARTSLSSYVGDYTNYYYIRLDTQSLDSQLYDNIIKIIGSNGKIALTISNEPKGS